MAMKRVIEFKGYGEMLKKLFCITANAERFFGFCMRSAHTRLYSEVTCSFKRGI